MKADNSYYVYAYFDPRNYELFYVGKGKGNRKYAHLHDKSDKLKARRIADIRRSGVEPVIKTVAAGLQEDQAYLVEKALIWSLGKPLTNLSGGKFAGNFRPSNTLHLNLPGFDVAGGVYFANVGGDYPHRKWDDCCRLGFLAAGYGKRFSSQLSRLEVGDIIAAYLKRKGYIGIGRVTAKSVPVRDFRYNGHRLQRHGLKGPDLFHDADDAERCEHLVGVKWIKTVPSEEARFRKRAGLFTTQLIIASLSRQPKTLRFLQEEFKVDFGKLLATR
jgi:hypothetical protein